MKKYLLTLSVTVLCFIGYAQTITFSSVPDLCANESTKNLTTLSNASKTGGTWKCLNCSGFNPISNNETFNPAAKPAGYTYNLRYVHAATMDSGEISIKVNSIPLVNAGTTDNSVCETETQVTLLSTPSGGTWSGAGTSGSQNLFLPGGAGVTKNGNNKALYTYTDPSTGCTGKDSVEIYVQIAPTVRITTDEPYVRCKNEKFYISATASNSPSGIIWSTTDGDINNVTPSPMNAQITYTPSSADITRGSVLLHLENQNFTGNQCAPAVDEITLTIDTCTATSTPLIEAIDVTVYPNPANSTVTIEKQNNTPFTISLVSMDGRLVYSVKWEATEKKHTINRNNIPAGIYYILLTDNNGNQYQKKLVFN